MKKTFFIIILTLLILLSSCGLKEAISDELFGTVPSDFDELMSEYIDEETNEPSEETGKRITVVCGEKHTKKINEEYLYPVFLIHIIK